MQIHRNTNSTLTHLECSVCGSSYRYNIIQTFSSCCQAPLFAAYSFLKESYYAIEMETQSLWRYASMLPLLDAKNRVSLNEGWTPIIPFNKIRDRLSIKQIFLKDEGRNPTGSFKARGLCMAISKAKELGISKFIMPSAGNAASALAAYAAKAGMESTIVMPRITPESIKETVRMYGSNLILEDGLINACAKKVKQLMGQIDSFDLSTMKEPYRLEGKKTMGYELAEQLNWQVPEHIIFPTGGGTGLIGIWKAMKEMKSMKWIKGRLPKMILVQTENCNPMIKMFKTGLYPENFIATASQAFGLAVPDPFAKKQIQQTIVESGGTCIEVSESEMLNGMQTIAATEGFLLSPEGSAGFIGLKKLIEKDFIKEDESVLFFNTCSWNNYR